jgi:hypothetical protein
MRNGHTVFLLWLERAFVWVFSTGHPRGKILKRELSKVGEVEREIADH